MNERVCLLRVVACILPHEIDRSSFACLCAVAAHTHTAGGTPMISLHSYEESDTITRHHREREREREKKDQGERFFSMVLSSTRGRSSASWNHCFVYVGVS